MLCGLIPKVVKINQCNLIFFANWFGLILEALILSKLNDYLKSLLALFLHHCLQTSRICFLGSDPWSPLLDKSGALCYFYCIDLYLY